MNIFSPVFTVDDGKQCEFPRKIYESETNVCKVLRKLPNNVSRCTPDGVPALFLKKVV